MRTYTDLSNLFRGQTTSTDILFLNPKTGVKCLLTGSKNAQIAVFSQYCINFFTFPYLYALRYNKWEILPLSYALGAEKMKNLIPISYSIANCCKLP